MPVNTQAAQVQGCTEFVTMLREIAPGCKSTGGLSNTSNGAPDRLRPILNRTYAIFLKRYGMYSVIANAFDEELRAILTDKRPDLEALVHKGNGRRDSGALGSLEGGGRLRQNHEGPHGPDALFRFLARIINTRRIER